MHRGVHDHDHAPMGAGHRHGHGANATFAMPGHNGGPAAAQWQTPHLTPGQPREAEPTPEPDLDLVEASFVEGFAACSDPTSFLRLAGIPFVGNDAKGHRLCLLRVQIEDLTDIGSAVPLVGGAGMRYAPLPGRLASRRRRLSFVYHDGKQLLRLGFAAARGLAPSDLSEPAPAMTGPRDGLALRGMPATPEKIAQW
jgi:hypothetical protein